MSAALTFLGLCEKSGKLVIGEESCGIAARAKKAKLILTARDAGRSSAVKAENYSGAAKCPSVCLPYSKSDLGNMLGRGSPGMLAVTDIGLASAFANKLSAEFPGVYDEVNGLLAFEADRAAQRRKEKQNHLKNIRRGKKKHQ